ncbi:PREDICTED: uncharacterized protein LOC109214447 [Nicotiana attenuata]|uniref:uncharacterized protein LOC109214447 n=1 Tax=Nicotiana attenuata TaxID=49451 RepID=UPI0009047A53|nr:PREDICTED: uncharacterized protein LOC109214447 [Nicotiana attenuata]
MYKLTAKVITNTLKQVVDKIVGPAQSAFIEGRNILDNVIVAHELVKGYNRRGISPRCLVKVDIRKAYDTVEWDFLRMVLLEFGIPVQFVKLIMECVSTVSYSIIFNGGLTPKFQAKKGLRQGDPMSPFLFVLTMEYLNRSLKQLRFRQWISCLKANMEKSSLYITGVDQQLHNKIYDEMHFAMGEIPFKYLGVPLSSKKITVQQCMPLIFLIPKKVMQLITSACRTFLWTGQCATSRRALVAWERLCMPKLAGGLNIIEFQTWNKAALSKLLWAIAAKKDTLWVQWIHSFYIKSRNINEMETPKQACWVVKKIFDARKWYGSNDLCTELQQLTHAGKFMIKKAYDYLLPQYLLPELYGKNST